MKATQWFTQVNGLSKTSPYGPRTYTLNGQKVSDFHRGIDFGGVNVRGKPILTPAGGLVTSSGMDTSGYGNYVGVTIDTGHKLVGYTLVFAHLDTRVTKGAEVRRGDSIGKLGNTGKSNGPHLHFQINRPGTGVKGSGYAGDPDDFDFGEERTVDFVLVNTWADVPFAKWLMERKKAFMAWRNDAGLLVGDLSQARTIYVCGGRVDDLPKGPKIINLSGADAFATVANIGREIKS